MLLKFSTLLLLLVMINSGVTYADDVGFKHLNKSESNFTNMGLILDGHIYEIQRNTSRLEFRVDSPVGDVWGSFQDFEGSFVMLNSGTNDQAAVIEINAESLDTNAGFIRAMLKSESFFDVEKFPSMRFVGSSFEWFNETQAVLKGEMTIQETTLPVAFYVELVNANIENKYSERITVKVSTTIKRSEFGMYTLLPIVSDNVNIFMSINALKRGTAVSMRSANEKGNHDIF